MPIDAKHGAVCWECYVGNPVSRRLQFRNQMTLPTLSSTRVCGSRRRNALVAARLPLILLGVALLGVAPSRAVASCGDYVTYNRQMAGPADFRGRQDRMDQHGMQPLGHDLADRSLPEKAPCHGPECRQSKPLSPLPAPSAPPTTGSRGAAALCWQAAHDQSPFQSAVGPALRESPRDGFARSLLRPPIL